MKTEIANSSGTSIAAAPERNAFEQYSEAVNRNRIVGDLLKFSKGDWLSGQNGDEVTVGTRLVAAMDEFMVGWVKWEEGKPTDMQMGRVVDGFVPPKRADLGDHDKDQWETDDNNGQPRDPWQLTNYLILKEEKGDRLYTFATSSKGGLNAVGALCGTYGKAMRQKPDQFPIVALKVDSYNHPNKAYGRIKTPILEVVGWAGKEAILAAIDGEAAETEQTSAEDADEPVHTTPTKGRKSASVSETTRF